MEDHPIESHVVLVSPEVHWNTGNTGRTCLGAGAFLHLIKPLGFSLGSRELKRAGPDYWPGCGFLCGMILHSLNST
jgi:tRNA (cytidine/uridine-2'-O-)-methyltransferase